MSDLFEAIVAFKICVLTIDDLFLVDEDPVEVDDVEESSFAKWFSSFEFIVDLAFATMSDLFDAIVALKICVLTIDDLFLVDEDPVEVDDVEESSFAKWFSSFQFIADLAFATMSD